MAALKKVILALVAITVLFVGVGFFLPSEFRVERSITIDAPAEKVFAKISDLRAWRQWGVWYVRDPKMMVAYGGPEMEVGMTSRWQSETQGNGQMEIIAMEPPRKLVYSLYFPDMDMGSTGEFTLQERDGETRVIWVDYGDVGSNPINHYFAAMMDSMIGPDFEAGLANLKTLVESNEP